MNFLYNKLETILSAEKLSDDERRKRVLIALFIIIISPVLTVYGILDIQNDNISEGLITLTISLLLFINLALIRLKDNILPVFRITNFAGLLIVIYELIIGGGRGHSFVWFYIFPQVSLFIFGPKEGSFWTILSFIAAYVILTFDLSSYKYPDGMANRFLVTYCVSIFIAYVVENSRRRYFNNLLKEKLALEEAISEVKSLRELLPICSFCKKVRDDKGYWKKLEDYIQEHLDADLSHGICPECLKEHYSISNKDDINNDLGEKDEK